MDTPTAEQISEMSRLIQQEFIKLRNYILSKAGQKEHTSKKDGSPQTPIDLLVEDTVLSAFRAEFPNIPIFGEESGYSSEMPNVFWLIDPIDGTASYMENVPAFTCMAVLIVNEQPVASVIYNPTTEDMFTAQKGHGAYKNDQRLKLSNTALPKKALCKGRYISTLEVLLLSAGVTCEIGSIGAGHGFSQVADGTVAARFQLNSKGYPHDYATGALLLSEAGGKIILLKDVEYSYTSSSFVACHPKLESVILDNLEVIRALEDQ
jgi:myo-inositol-1(or 4)-monophosphatase